MTLIRSSLHACTETAVNVDTTVLVPLSECWHFQLSKTFTVTAGGSGPSSLIVDSITLGVAPVTQLHMYKLPY